MTEIRVREAFPDDVPLILSLIKELAEYERLSHEVVATEDSLKEWLFGERPVTEVLIGEYGEQPAGFALYFHNFSTFLGKPGIYWRISTSGPSSGAPGSALPYSSASPGSRVSAAAGGWSGPFSTGTSLPSNSTSRWAPPRSAGGRFVASPERRSMGLTSVDPVWTRALRS
jgi:hypothetical protein